MTPLEKLLDGSVLEDLGSARSFASYNSDHDGAAGSGAAATAAKLETAMRRLGHLTEVLGESEANNQRLAEQVRVLKEEIRRMERNEERLKHVANSEYLKNVIIKVKFATENP